MRRALFLASGLLMLSALVWPQTAGAKTAKQTPLPPAVRALPVTSCPTTYGAGSSGSPFVARQLATTSPVRGLTFYSNGLITVLGPSGWACGALVAADGGESLVVYPPGKPDYATSEAPKGAALVEADTDYTGHLPGAERVCGLFPGSAASSYVSSGELSCPKTPGQKTSRLTPDVVLFADPPGVSGSGSASGGLLPSLGAAVYPQLDPRSSTSVEISVLSCTLSKSLAALCPAIRGDFLVRNPPTYLPSAANG
jgi:hypothetical protein